MNLVINVDATDKAAAAVVSSTDRTPVDELRELVLGNQEPLTLDFCDDTGARPSWVTNAAVSLVVGLGRSGIDGSQAYAISDPLAITGNTRTGTLDLGTTALQQALYSWCSCGKRGKWMLLEVRKADASGNFETLALLNVFVLWRVLAAS